MPLKDTDYNLIDKYIQGKLTAEERKYFVTRQKDTDFQKELDWRKDGLAVFKKNGRLELKNRLKELDKEIVKKQEKTALQLAKTTTISVRSWLSIAAGLSIIIAMFWWWNTQPYNTDELFAQYYEPFPNVVAPLVKSETSSTEYEIAFQSYEQGNYEQAVDLLTKIESEEGQFYLGLAYLGQENATKAISHLVSTAKQPTNRFYQASQWYLALAYLKTNQPSKAIEILDLIQQDSGHIFYDKVLIVRKLL